jgi:hypothetical protein
MKIGFVSMPITGYLNPMTALARKLESRGNEVVFFGVPDAEPIVRAAHLNFVPFCEKEYPVGSVAEGYAVVARLRGEDVVRYSSTEMHPGRCARQSGHFQLFLKYEARVPHVRILGRGMTIPNQSKEKRTNTLSVCRMCIN